MPDPFALLGLPRRPWLDESTLRSAFQERAKACHPDKAGGDPDRFAVLNAAQAALADSATRLQLLAGGAAAPGMPPDPDLGFRIGHLLQEADAVASRVASTSNPLQRALLAPGIADLRRTLQACLEELDNALARADEVLRDLDASWPDVDPARLARLSSEYRFLHRWQVQLRERKLALSL